MSIFRPYRRRHGVSIFKLQHGSYAVATLTPIMPFQKRNVSRGSKMSITISNIRTELISDFAAGRLDAEDAQVIKRPSITTKSSRQLSRMRAGSIRE